MIEIPYQQLSEEALLGIIEAFILREGTDYGAVEVAFERKVEQVKKQLESGRIVIVFDAEAESCNILDRDEFMQFQREQGA